MKKNRKVILASSSPRRKEIIVKLGLDFEVIPSDYDEILESLDFSYEKIEKLAYNKAKAVAEKLKHGLILSADTVVVLDNKILGKPKDDKDAFFMLSSLSDKKHCVVTSSCLIDVDNKYSNIISTTSYVEFEKLSEEMIIGYIKKFNPLDKAGSYGIQELPEGFIKNVEGSFENIVGLCSDAVLTLLKNYL